MSYAEDITKFWEQAHKTQNPSDLTGTSLKAHAETLQVDVANAKAVLCIGIGQGDWVIDLAHLGPANLHALDISSVARRKVAHIATTHETPLTLPINYFDVAMSHWVAPHMNDPELQLQLQHVVSSLTDDGLFALHYSEPLHESDAMDNRCGCPNEADMARLAAMLRRRGQMAQMVACAGGVVVRTILLDKSVECNRKFVVAHIKKATKG